jgi:hypothetical protein
MTTSGPMVVEQLWPALCGVRDGYSRVEEVFFTQWLEQRGKTPKEITTKNRMREILGLPKAAAS